MSGETVEPLPPGFRRFWWGEAVSGFGSAVTGLALQTLVVVTLGGTAVQVGWLNAATWLPYLVLGLVVCWYRLLAAIAEICIYT